MPDLKKIIIFIICFLIVFAVFSRSHKNYVLADKTQSQTEFETKVDNTTFSKEDADKATVENIVHSLNIAILGPTTSSLEATEPVGAVGVFGNFIAGMISNPPVRTSEYLADLGANLGLPIKPAYAQAQGTGWRALAPILPVWRAFRNIAYMGFVIIFIVIGFMVMFRAKINPQTVISVQAALPKIILTLLLITFSYAMAGLMIDLIYILIYLFTGVFGLFGLITDPGAVADYLLTTTPFRLVYQPGEDFFTGGPAAAITELITGLFGNWEAGEGLNILGVGLQGLAKLVLGIAILFSLIKLFFSLLLSYLNIIISVIFAPFNLLFNAFPASNAFVGWIKNLFANVIVFPAVAGLFLIAAVLIGPRHDASQWHLASDVGFYSQRGERREVWAPPFLFGDEGGGGEPTAFQGLISLGMILMMPQLVTQIKKMLKIEGGAGFSGAIMGGIIAGPQFMLSAPQAGWQFGKELGYFGIGPLRPRYNVHEPPPAGQETKRG